MLLVRLLILLKVIYLSKSVRVRVTYTPEAPSSVPNELFHEIINITYFDVRVADKNVPEPQYAMNFEEITYRTELNESEIVSFYSFRNLKFVSMINNGQKTMPNFRDLPKLRKIQIRKTKISKIGSNNVGMTPVEVLDLQENLIEDIGKGAFGKKIHSIDLKCNKLSKIESNWFKNAKSVEWLNFENNQITALQEDLFKKFKRLSELYLSKNFITHLESGSLSGPTYFHVLDLGTNDISIINPNIFSINHTFIDNFKISFNRLSFLTKDLMDKISINNNSFIYGNPWQCPCVKPILDWLPVNNVKYIVPNEASCIFTKDFDEECIFNENLNTELYNTFISSYAVVEARICASEAHNINENQLIELPEWSYGAIDLR